MSIRLRGCCRKNKRRIRPTGDGGVGGGFKSVGLSHQGDTCWEQPVHLPRVDRPTARNKPQLASLGITHVLNAAHGPRRIDTGPRFYSGAGVEYLGVEALDSKDFDLTPFFGEAARFIDAALRQQGSNCRLWDGAKVAGGHF